MNDLAHLRIFAGSPKCSLSENVKRTKTSRVCSFNDLDKNRILGDVKALRAALLKIQMKCLALKNPKRDILLWLKLYLMTD